MRDGGPGALVEVGREGREGGDFGADGGGGRGGGFGRHCEGLFVGVDRAAWIGWFVEVGKLVGSR